MLEATMGSSGPKRSVEVEAARALYVHAGSGHDFDHVLRVLALAERIAHEEGANLEVVHTAALLHDIGESQGRELHHLRGAEMAREILRGQSAEFIEAVAHAIEAHRFRADPAPRTLEAQILSDADKLDAIGAIGIARAFAYAGAHATALWRVPWREIAAAATPTGENARQRPQVLGTDYTPGHEFVYKLDRIPKQLYTVTARAMAVRRQEFMRAFFDRLDQEAAGLE